MQPIDGGAARALEDVHLVAVVLLLLALGVAADHGRVAPEGSALELELELGLVLELGLGLELELGLVLGRHVDVLPRRRARRHALGQPVADPHLGQLAVVEGHRVELRRVNKVGAWAVKCSEFGDLVQAPARRRCSLSSACTARGLSPLGPRG